MLSLSGWLCLLVMIFTISNKYIFFIAEEPDRFDQSCTPVRYNFVLSKFEIENLSSGLPFSSSVKDKD